MSNKKKKYKYLICDTLKQAVLNTSPAPEWSGHIIRRLITGNKAIPEELEDYVIIAKGS
jgi:hypothetical protein